MKSDPNTQQNSASQNPKEEMPNEEALLSAFNQWKSDFLSLSPKEQQNILFNMMCDRLYWRIVYYMRRFPEKLTSSQQTYSDRCIGYEELMAYMGHIDPNGYAATWLEENHIPPMPVIEERLTRVETQLQALLEIETSSCAILRMKQHFQLNTVEMAILSTLVIIMSVEHLMRLSTVAWADFSVRQPTVAFICQLFSDTPEQHENVYQAFADQGTLRRMRLIVLERHAALPNYTPLMYAPIAIEQTVIDAFCDRAAARELPPNMTLHKDHLPMRALMIEPHTRDELRYAMKNRGARICLSGPTHSGRRTILCTTAIKSGHAGVLEVDMASELEPNPIMPLEARLASMMREALFEGSVLMLRFDTLEDHPEWMQQMAKSHTQLSRIAANFPGTLALLVQKPNHLLEDIFGTPICIHLQPPTLEMAQNVWRRALAPWAEPEDIEKMAHIFAQNYSLPIGSIFAVVRNTTEALQTTGTEINGLQSHHILNEIRKSFRHQLGTLAEITVSDVPLSGVVLPIEAKLQVDEILQYAKNLHNVLDVWGFRQRSPYGNALSVLFAGPPGTGKTLLACALANELGKVLYRVDLSRIVDKYIGETEKNLGKIFDEAAKAQAIILFDEADSLFAKRTEVKSSNDRYANLEINYLLQKLESYNGITILTTNLSKSIDEAFRRRLRFIIDFPMPDVPSRVELWKRMMPPHAPQADDIRWSWLAKTFEMSGGYIRNAVLKAAITASASQQPIGMQHLAKAAADEARSMGKLMRIDDAYDEYDDDDDYYRD